MRRGIFCIAVAAALARVGIATEEGPARRAFRLEYRAAVGVIPAGAKAVELWIPVPHDGRYQKIGGLKITSSYPYTEAADAEGNQMLHVAVARPEGREIWVTMQVDAVRWEHRQPLISGDANIEGKEGPADLARWLRPDRLVPIDATIRKMAREVVNKAGARTDLQMARAIYDHVVATVKYDKTGKGWGRGDIYYACETRRGNCTDFHAIFIGYCRAMGIPARFAIGFPLPVERGKGKIAGYHCWAEFYAKGIGWVPIDASEAAKNPARREYFFGAHDENRLEFSRGRDLVLTPRQKGEPLNYFIHPYAEVDGAEFAGVAEDVTYEDAPGR